MPATPSSIPTFHLGNGHPIPAVGLGTWQSKPGEVAHAVEHALHSGYRHIDAAWIYRNENEVGDGIRKSGVPREEIFVTTKLWNTFHRPENVPKGLKESLDNLGLDYVDLYLMHWPSAFMPGKEGIPRDENGKVLLDDVDYKDTWAAMEKLLETGKVKAIGISNFSTSEVKDLLDHCKVRPAAHQIELHPYSYNQVFEEFHRDRGILIESYSTFGNLNPIYEQNKPPLAETLPVVEASHHHDVHPSTIILSWAVAHGFVTLPKSVHNHRIEDNLRIVKLANDEVKAIDDLADGTHFNDPSKSWGYKFFRD